MQFLSGKECIWRKSFKIPFQMLSTLHFDFLVFGIKEIVMHNAKSKKIRVQSFGKFEFL